MKVMLLRVGGALIVSGIGHYIFGLDIWPLLAGYFGIFAIMDCKDITKPD